MSASPERRVNDLRVARGKILKCIIKLHEASLVILELQFAGYVPEVGAGAPLTWSIG